MYILLHTYACISVMISRVTENSIGRMAGLFITQIGPKVSQVVLPITTVYRLIRRADGVLPTAKTSCLSFAKLLMVSLRFLLGFLVFVVITVVIITWPTEKPSQKNNSDIKVFRVTDWLKWFNLFKISSLMSQFLTNKRT